MQPNEILIANRHISTNHRWSDFHIEIVSRSLCTVCSPFNNSSAHFKRVNYSIRLPLASNSYTYIRKHTHTHTRPPQKWKIHFRAQFLNILQVLCGAQTNDCIQSIWLENETQRYTTRLKCLKSRYPANPIKPAE